MGFGANKNTISRKVMGRWIRIILILSSDRAEAGKAPEMESRYLYHALNAMGDDSSNVTFSRCLNEMLEAGWIEKRVDRRTSPKKVWHVNIWRMSEKAISMWNDGIIASSESFQDYRANEDGTQVVMKQLRNSTVGEGTNEDVYTNE